MPQINESDKPKLTRSEQSRINGAKSKGPQSARGRERSSLNRTTHGMYSSRVVLHSECQQTYNDLADLFLALFQPKDVVEHELVYNLINSRWKIRRLEAASTAALDLAIAEARPEFEQKYDNLTPDHENALAYRALAQTAGNTDMMGRHEDRQHRLFDRSYRLLAKHRGKQNALPTNEDMMRAEADLPPGNLPPQTERLEPEKPAAPVLVKPTPPKERKKPKEPEDDEPRNPNCVYEDEYKLFKPLSDALADYPELRMEISETIRKYQERTENEAA